MMNRLAAWVAAAALAIPLPVFAREAPSAAGITIDAANARPVALTVAGRELSLPESGGFEIYDATTAAAVKLPRGRVSGSDGDRQFETTAKDAGLELKARFERQENYTVVRGTIENLRGDERGFIVDYVIPTLGPKATFSHHLEHSAPMDGEDTEANAVPVGAMSTGDAGVALAIPPDEPRVFGVAGGESGLRIRFYLGTSPKPKRFPNEASFEFIIYGIEPEWGFRSALSRYYGFFPDYYQQRLKKEGLMMFQMTDRNPPNIDDYGFHLSETQWGRAVLHAAITRDERHDITTFPYMIVGQREVKHLPKLPTSYKEAMAAYENWDVAQQASYQHTKENAASQGDIHLKEEVESSALRNADGTYSLLLRDTLWGGPSVTFKTNPNPDLFADRDGYNVGRYALELIDRWLEKRPEYDGMFVDSLGANWPAALNYRADHFVYARYPLTFDPNGTVALHNVLSHYEYIETLREKMYATGRLILGNGVYAYNSRGVRKPRGVERQEIDDEFNEFHPRNAPPEHYRAGAKLGRFFVGALLDVASSEIGVKATLERCEDVRVIMGRKPYAFLNYHWEDGDLVETFVNKSLGFGIFASSNTNWNTGDQYESSPDGYGRDKELIAWFVPLVRMISKAGWEPVSYATVSGGTDITCERFGKGDVVYYSLYNDGDEPHQAHLQIDLASLGLADRPVSFSEVARQSDVYQTSDGTLTFTMAPKKAYIIAVKAGPDA